MSEQSVARFELLANIYSRYGAINHPSELHGLLVGRLSGGKRATPEQWQSEVIAHMAVELEGNEIDLDTKLIADIFDEALTQLQSTSFEFELMLPDDEYSLSERIEALGVWVRGYLEGLALSAGKRLMKLDKELQELLRDLVAITQIDDETEDSEEGEKEWMEIAEFVRIAALTLFAELNPTSRESGTAGKGLLH
ncbi:MAG: UPF0149 family protein [Hahellaceae bacterium]|nr:UPF0149 family protein [Hahellaceae bacterium]MCP5168621.1 UPF0149 family protein [Hahellaceae bacterium]